MLKFSRTLRVKSEVSEQDLQQEFETFGGVGSVSVITDKYSGQSKGFAFIEMSSVSEGQAAITGLNGKTLKERTLTVNAARPRTDNRSGGYSGDRRGSGDSRGRGGEFGGGRQRRY